MSLFRDEFDENVISPSTILCSGSFLSLFFPAFFAGCAFSTSFFLCVRIAVCSSNKSTLYVFVLLWWLAYSFTFHFFKFRIDFSSNFVFVDEDAYERSRQRIEDDYQR